MNWKRKDDWDHNSDLRPLILCTNALSSEVISRWANGSFQSHTVSKEMRYMVSSQIHYLVSPQCKPSNLICCLISTLTETILCQQKPHSYIGYTVHEHFSVCIPVLAQRHWQYSPSAKHCHWLSTLKIACCKSELTPHTFNSNVNLLLNLCITDLRLNSLFKEITQPLMYILLRW